jgi:hypothetical protein
MVVAHEAVTATRAAQRALEAAKPAEPAPIVLRGSQVTVNTRDDQSIRGILLQELPDRLTLAQASYRTGDRDTPMDGYVHIPTDNVAWMQTT